MNEWVDGGVNVLLYPKLWQFCHFYFVTHLPVQENYAAQNHPIVTWMVSFVEKKKHAKWLISYILQIGIE